MKYKCLSSCLREIFKDKIRKTNSYKSIFVLLLGFLILYKSFLFSEENDIFIEAPADTTYVSADTLTQTAVFDSLYYDGDILYYFVDEDRILLIGNTQIIYQTNTIRADSLNLNFESNQAFASGNIQMQDGDQMVLGESAYYDIETETGIILNGAGRFDQGFYYGREIRKVGENVFDLDHGRFTSCDALHPHFDFRATSMRMYHNDALVGRPIFFYVNDFPLLVAPYAAISIRSGRRSGFLMPSPSYNSQFGKYFEDIGYFWAINDYSDITFLLDLYEKRGYEFRTQLVYLDRYRYNGNLESAYVHRQSDPDSYATDWRIRYTHFQNLPERATFNASINYATSREIYDGETDPNLRLIENVSSIISYRKPMRTSDFSAMAEYKENLKTSEKYISLPSFSYNLSSRPLHEYITFIPDNVRREDHWWKSFSGSWRLAGSHVGIVNDENPTFSQILWDNIKDENGRYIVQHNAGLRQNISVSHNETLFGWLRLSNSFNYTDAVFDRDREDNKFVHGYSYGTNHRLSFNLYGTQVYRRGPITAVRHIVTPSASYRYSPDFSDNRDRFYNFGTIGVSSSQKVRTIDLGLDNKWQFRLIPNKDEQERRINDLFSLQSSTGYDFERETKPWRNINHSLSLNPGSYSVLGVNFGINQSYSMTMLTYEDLKVSSWRMNSSLRFSGDAVYYDHFPIVQNDFVTGNLFRPDTLSVNEQQIMTIQDLEKLENPGSWSLTMSHDYNKERISGRVNQNLRNTLNLRLTHNWSLTYYNYIDIEKREMMSQSINLNRDLHCWRLNFVYSQSSQTWNFSINLVNIKLPELKVPYKGAG